MRFEKSVILFVKYVRRYQRKVFVYVNVCQWHIKEKSAFFFPIMSVHSKADKANWMIAYPSVRFQFIV